MSIVRNIKFANQTGREIAFTHRPPYVLDTFSGFDSTGADDQTEAGGGQDGETYVGTSLTPRDLSVTFYVRAAGKSALAAARREAKSILSNRLGLGVLTWEDSLGAQIIRCKVTALTEVMLSNSLMQIKADFTAYDPYFYEPEDSSIRMAYIVQLLEFAADGLCIPAEGVEFDVFAQELNVENLGDAPTPVTIRFYGGAINPQFTNLSTGEFVRVKWTVPADTVLEINTGYGKKSVTLIAADGTRTNAFSHLDLESTFWQLVPGENKLTYSADGDTRTTEAEIIYNLRRLGV